MPSTRPLIFIDSADREKVESLFSTGAFVGLTTNPTILERDGARIADLPVINAWARAAGALEVCFQTWGADAVALRTNAARLLDIDARTVIKVPATAAGFEAAEHLIDQGVALLLTAVFRPSQMVAACAVGARYVAPYLGRMADTGSSDAMADVVAMHRIAEQSGSSTRVLAASVRRADDVADLVAAGIPAVTLSPALAWDVLCDDRAEQAAEVFDQTVDRLL
ncbi:transaldolase family protein [Actinotalea sp. K2]|uniref:transaldolase family protein n=1 Tax=Actinotalea sp. K2 TaxID=2939438 RepID=UPI002017D443|nr:transaldolase family protein [Actinotalea sp. K2]MCL3862076.1 hypothetical protein [Actinotalea sp. K2]